MKLFKRIKERKEEKKFLFDALKLRREVGFNREELLNFSPACNDNSLNAYFSKIKGLKR